MKTKRWAWVFVACLIVGFAVGVARADSVVCVNGHWMLRKVASRGPDIGGHFPQPMTPGVGLNCDATTPPDSGPQPGVTCYGRATAARCKICAGRRCKFVCDSQTRDCYQNPDSAFFHTCLLGFGEGCTSDDSGGF